uniref:Peptidase C14 caspase domain-containing protein n=1 Tax=viral metagenome TaxID=1070528 RepID=A0A6C0KD18_9ZZZZ
MATYALLIGCNYTGTKHELKGCDKDISDIRDFLMERGYAEGPDNRMVVLNDPKYVTVIEEIEKLVNYVNAEDEPVDVFFQYSGHGSKVLDKDETDLKDECLVSTDLKLITDDYLKSQFSKLPSTTRMFCLIDACHSGSSLDLDFNCNSDHEGELVATIDPTIFMLSGCRDAGYSQTIKSGTIKLNLWGGAMTSGFLAVTKHMEKHHIELNMSQLLDFVRISTCCVPQVPQLTSSCCNFTDHYISCEKDSFAIYNDDDICEESDPSNIASRVLNFIDKLFKSLIMNVGAVKSHSM